MKKILSLALILSLSITLLIGCNKSKETTNISVENETKVKVIVSAPKSPVAIPILRMVETNVLGEENKIDLKLYSSMEEMTALATSNDYSFMSIAVNSAATLYNKNMDIKLINVGTWGGMYLVTTDKSCNNWEDLKGKQLYVPNKGSVPDVIAQYFLNKHNIKVGSDVEFVYSTHPEIAQLIKSGKAIYAIDAEPFATSNKENISNYNIVSDYVNEWKKSQGDEYDLPASCIITNGKFLSDNEELVNKFNEEYEKALKWTKENPVEASQLAEKYLNSDSNLMEKAIPNIPMLYKTSIEAKSDIEKYYNILLDFKAESIGGKLPDENFYYKEK